MAQTIETGRKVSESEHPPTEGTGTSTVGSSEAIMLAVLNMKWAWRKKRIAQGKPHDKPNLVGRERGREGGREH